MIDSLNLNTLSVDKNGRVSFSGLNSGIDFQKAVDAIIAAKRIPVDTLTQRVTENEAKITALRDLKTRLNAVKEALSTLYGSISFGDVNNIFAAKQVFASTSRLDGGTASSAGNLLGVSVANSAASGAHSIEVLRIAKAHKISSDRFTSTTTALGLTSGDTFTLNGQSITVSGSDTLQDLRDRINSANTGTSATGVSASIVSVSSTEHYLVLTKDASGAAMTIANGTGTPLATVGLLTAGGAIKNELQAAQTARFYADGLLDQTNTIYESSLQAASTTQIGSAGTLSFVRTSDSAVIGTVNYAATDTLAQLAANITANVTGVTASVVQDGAKVRIEISGASAFTFSETGAGTAISALGLDNKRLTIERASNTVTDLFAGVTLTLVQAEQGTSVKIDVEQDLSKVKTQIQNFVTAYNELKSFINEQTLSDPNTGAKSEDAGALFGSRTIAGIEQALSRFLGDGTTGVNEAFRVLPQIGIKFVDNKTTTDPLLFDTLTIDDSVLDSKLLSNAADVRRLFAFDFSASDPRIRLLGFTGNTAYNAAGFTLNLQPNTGSNQALHSEEIDNAAWTKVRTSVTANAIAGPNGQTTADALIADATNATHYVTNAAGISVTAGSSYVVSSYAKAGASGSLRLQLSGGSFGANAYADFNLSTGAITTTGTDSDNAKIESVGNGWYRVSLQATATGTGTANFDRYSVNGGSTTFAGDGTTVQSYLWGAQFETASTATQTITSFTTTRATVNSDVATAPDSTATADAIVASVDNATHLIANSTAMTVNSGTAYSYTSYVKVGARSQARLTLGGANFAANAYADFNLAAGTVATTGAGLSSAQIESAGSGWYRVTVTGTATGTGTASFELNPIDAATGATFAGDGATVDTFFWNPKVVAAPGAGGYVATTTAAVSGVAASANIGGAASGAADGSATVNGSVVTVDTGDATGVSLFFSGFTVPSSLTFNYTVGLASTMFFEISEMVAETNGTIETEIDNLTDQNEVSNDRMDEMLVRIEYQRVQLLERFIRMEQALSTSTRIIESLRQSAAALSNSQGQ